MSTLAIDEIELPAFPEVAAAVLRKARDPDAGIHQIATLVQRDPTLAAEVLRVANSAAMGGRTPAVTLLHAIGRLGVAAVADLTVAVCLRPQATAPDVQRRLTPVWRHAVATAGFARRISAMRRRQVESAFLCGLLHNIGAITLIHSGITNPGVIHDRYIEVGIKIRDVVADARFGGRRSGPAPGLDGGEGLRRGGLDHLGWRIASRRS